MSGGLFCLMHCIVAMWERSECKNYRGIYFLSVVEKIYAGILVERARRVTEELNDDEK